MKHILSVTMVVLLIGAGCRTAPPQEQVENKELMTTVQTASTSTDSTKEWSRDVAAWKRKTLGPFSRLPHDTFENVIQFSYPPQWEVITAERTRGGWGNGIAAEVAIGGLPSSDNDDDAEPLLANARFYIIEFTPPTGTSPLAYYKEEIAHAKQGRTFVGYKKVGGINGLLTDQGNVIHPARRWLELPVKNKMIVIIDTTYDEKLFNDFLSTISFNKAIRTINDINGDGVKEAVSIIGVPNPDDPIIDDNAFSFKDAKIPILAPNPGAGGCMRLSDLYDVGDIDEDGGHEMAVYLSSCASRFKSISVFSLKNNQWIEAGSAGYDTGYTEPSIPKRITKIGKGKFKIREIVSVGGGEPITDREIIFDMSKQ